MKIVSSNVFFEAFPFLGGEKYVRREVFVVNKGGKKSLVDEEKDVKF